MQGFGLCNADAIMLKMGEKLSRNRNEREKGEEANSGSTEMCSRVPITQTARSGESNTTVALLFFSISVVFNSIGVNLGPTRRRTG